MTDEKDLSAEGKKANEEKMAAMADEEKRADEEAKAVAKARAAERRKNPLVKMTKEGDEVKVHPTCVAAHEAACWVIVDA